MIYERGAERTFQTAGTPEIQLIAGPEGVLSLYYGHCYVEWCDPSKARLFCPQPVLFSDVWPNGIVFQKGSAEKGRSCSYCRGLVAYLQKRQCRTTQHIACEFSLSQALGDFKALALPEIRVGDSSHLCPTL